MRLAEQVTFGLGGIDRAAHLRGDDVALAALKRGACILPMWRGKPLVSMASPAAPELALVAADHPILDHATAPPTFLGRSGACGIFSADVSAWQPEEMPEALDSFIDRSRQPMAAQGAREPAFTELRTVMALLSRRDAALAATVRALGAWHRSHGFCAACGQPSTVTQAGWQRTCPVCGTHHFPRTDPVVIMLITQGNSLLLGRSPPWPEGMYSLLAGFVEPGETVEDAVRREVFEESGVAVGRVDYLSSQPWPYPSSLMIGCRGTAHGRELTLDPLELDDALWISREELMEVFAGQHPKIKPARAGAIARFLMQNWLADRLD